MSFPVTPEISAQLAAFARGDAAAREAAAGGVPLAASVLPFARFREDAALRAAWRRLEVAAAMPMQGLGFAAALADTFAAGADIQVFAVGEGGDLAGLMPLCRGPGRGGRWTMLGANETGEPGDALCLHPEAVAALARALVADGRALELHRLPAGSPLIPALRAALKGKGRVSLRPASPMPTIALDPSWREPAAKFNAGRRSDFRRAARRAAALGTVSYEMLAPGPEEFDALFDEAVAVEARSWKRDAGTAIAVDRAKEECFRRFFRWGAERGMARIAFLRLDGVAVAMQMALEWGDRYWLFKIGFDEDYARCSPGSLLMLHSLGWAAGRGLVAYELLGNVEPWIATFWTQDGHGCVRLRAYPYTLRGGAAFAGDAWAWLRSRLPGRKTRMRGPRALLRDARYALPRAIGRVARGPGPAAAARRCARLNRAGRGATLGYFQANGAGPEEILAANRAAAGWFAGRGGDVQLALKAPPLGFDAASIRSMAEAADAAGLALIFDAHGLDHAEATLAAAAGLLGAFPRTGLVLPARWRRSMGDAARFRDTTARIRLVKGEWADPDWGEADVAANYLALAAQLAGRAAPVAVATHDPDLAERALTLLRAAGTPCELEQLRGLPGRRTRAVARRLGVPVRIYVPFGPGWWPYAVDKALARPYLLAWTLRDLFGR